MVVAVVVVAFSSLAKILGEGWTIRSPSAPFLKWRLAQAD